MRATIGLILLLIWLAGTCFGDQLWLANGDRISGTVRIEDDAITVTSEVFGKLKAPRNAVTRVVLEAPAPISMGDQTVTATSIAFSAATASVHLDGGEVIQVPAATIQSLVENQKPPPPEPAWNGSFEAGLTSAHGNTSLNNLHFAVGVAQTRARHRLRLSFQSLLVNTATAGRPTVSTAVIHSGARYEHNVSNNMFAFGLLTFDSDQQQKLDLRTVFGGGVGRRLADSSSATLDIFGGSTFNRETFSNRAGRNSGEFLVGGEVNYRMSTRVSISHRLALFPNFTSPGDVRMTFDATALTKFNKWMGWQFRLAETYITNPVNLARPNDVIITTGIRFTYGGEENKFNPRSKIPPLTN